MGKGTEMLADLERSGLDHKDAAKLRMVQHTAAEMEALGHHAVPGYAIPYFGLDGKPRDFYRVRFLADTRIGFQKATKAKPQRYSQPHDTAPEVYFPPLGVKWADIAADADAPILITEGEKKAAAATKNGLPCIALGGVWSFKAKKLGLRLLPALADGFEWQGRHVIICYDSDAVTNKDVRAAESALARELRIRGAKVFIARLPHSESAKAGLDDYLMAHGVDALRAILEAATESVNDPLEELNEEVVYVKHPGFVLEIASGAKMSPGNFHTHHYAPRKLEVATKKGAKTISAAKAWIEWPDRREASRIVFRPGEPATVPDEGGAAWNLWRGYTVEPVKGDVTPWRQLVDHLFHGSPAAERRWFEQWCAFPFQCPGRKMHTAVLMWSEKHGTGKTSVGYALSGIYGDSAVEIRDEELDNDFNGWAENKQFVMVDELTSSDSRKLTNKLKGMITRAKVRVNPKHVEPFTLEDFAHYYFTSNSPKAFHIEAEDRRFFVHEVTTGFIADNGFEAWRKSEAGRAALLHYLMHEVDLRGFEPTAPAPLTSSKRDVQEQSLSDVDRFVREMMESPEEYVSIYTSGDLLNMKQFRELVERHANQGRPIMMNDGTLLRKLKSAGGVPIEPKGAAFRMVSVNGERMRFLAVRNAEKWQLADADTLRKHFLKTTKGKK